MHKHAHKHKHTDSHVHIHTNACMQACLHTYACTNTQIHIHTSAHTRRRHVGLGQSLTNLLHLKCSLMDSSMLLLISTWFMFAAEHKYHYLNKNYFHHIDRSRCINLGQDSLTRVRWGKVYLTCKPMYHPTKPEGRQWGCPGLQGLPAGLWIVRTNWGKQVSDYVWASEGIQRKGRKQRIWTEGKSIKPLDQYMEEEWEQSRRLTGKQSVIQVGPRDQAQMAWQQVPLCALPSLKSFLNLTWCLPTEEWIQCLIFTHTALFSFKLITQNYHVFSPM